MAEQRVNILIYRPDGTLIAQYLLGDGEHLIGRDIHCPVYLDSEHISSNHAKLHLSAEGIYIEDLNSTTGTFIDGVTVRGGKLRIKPGQVLQAGDLTFDLQPESAKNIGPGTQLGDKRYTLIRLLSKGGMGEVWLAKDEQLEEEVALKKLPPGFASDASALADMRREVQKSRSLSHPNIIRIHDLYFKAREDPFITLEYVDGRDLTHIVAAKTNRVFGWEEIKPLVLQLCSALEFAHHQRVVHRDLKPANLMISRTSQVKLADFGIAASVADATQRSSVEGFISGTSLYMSPQQMKGEAPQASDDIYAFGATLYELLTSRPPFYTGKIEHQVLQVTPKPIQARLQEFGIPNDIPEYAEKLVMSCLAKDPQGRPQDMGVIKEWIKSEGAVKGALPKVSTKTVKRTSIVGASPEPILTLGRKAVKIMVMTAIIAVTVGLGILVKNQVKELSNAQQQLPSPIANIVTNVVTNVVDNVVTNIVEVPITVTNVITNVASGVTTNYVTNTIQVPIEIYSETGLPIDKVNPTNPIDPVTGLPVEPTVTQPVTPPFKPTTPPTTPKPQTASIVTYDRKFGFYVVNRGADYGIKSGHEFSVFRANKLVGKIRIKQVEPTVSIAESIKDLTPKQLQPGDKLRKIN